MYVFAKPVPDDEKWLRGGAYHNAYASVSVLALKGRSVYRVRETIPLPRCWFSWGMNVTSSYRGNLSSSSSSSSASISGGAHEIQYTMKNILYFSHATGRVEKIKTNTDESAESKCGVDSVYYA